MFRGNGEVKDGEFISDVFIPKNFDSNIGTAKIRLFASLNLGDEAIGAIQIPIGGTASYTSNDKLGPDIALRFGQNQSDASGSFPFSNLPLSWPYRIHST